MDYIDILTFMFSTILHFYGTNDEWKFPSNFCNNVKENEKMCKFKNYQIDDKETTPLGK